MILPGREVSPAAVADHYDDLDRFYRELWGEHVHHGLWQTGTESPEAAVAALVRLVGERARIGANSVVCDVGCGYGATALQLWRDRGSRVVGVTLSRAQHRRAAARSLDHPQLSFRLGDWLRCEVEREHYDAVLAIESTEHFADKAACLARAWEALRRGGSLVVCAWLAGPQPRSWEVRYLLEPICREGRLAGLGTVADYRELLAAAGFVRTSVEDLTEQAKPTWEICIRRLLRGLRRDSRLRRYLFSPLSRNRIFGLTLARIWLAYETGAMRYGMFRAEKPLG